MNDISYRFLKKDEVLKGVQVFSQSMGRVSNGKVKLQTENFVLRLFKNKIARFMVGELDNKKIVANGALIFQGESCWIGFMAVLPEFQRQGIGSKLFERLIEEALRLNSKSIDLYATEKGEQVYRKYGFQKLYSTSMYTILKVPPENKNFKIKIEHSIQPWIYRFDQEAVGYDRKLYLESGFQPNAKILCLKDRGYAILNNDRLGPLIADSSEFALEIVRTAYNHGARRILIPSHSKISETFFDTLELEEKAGTKNFRMTYADTIPSKLSFLYAIRSFAGG
ncbi:MAG: GNAT family N-acetyltransferase [Candidatus Hermodarchaeota archaeon]